MKHFITGAELTLEEQQDLIKDAISYKKGEKIPQLNGKILTAIFANPSLRTRLSFESGMKKLGGEINIINSGDSWNFEYADNIIMDGSTQEHIKEAAPVIGNYSDLIALRKSELMTTAQTHQSQHAWEELKKDQPINQLAKLSGKPVINMESNLYHPCQSLADMMTITETFGEPQKKKYVLTWAPHPKALPLATPHSQMLTPALFGMDVTVAHPEGFDLDDDVVMLAQEKSAQSGGSLKFTDNQEEAFKDADVIVAKSWASMQYFGRWEEEKKHRQNFENWIVTDEKMALSNDAKFMHCLPVRRNVVVEDKVLDHPNAIHIREAENRMWAQMAVINYLLKQQQ